MTSHPSTNPSLNINRFSNTINYQQSNSNSSNPHRQSISGSNSKQHFSGPSSSANANITSSSNIPRHQSQGSQHLVGNIQATSLSGSNQHTTAGTPVGGSSGGTGLHKIVITQILLLLQTAKKDEKSDNTLKQIQDHLDQSAPEVHASLLQRLLVTHFNTIFSPNPMSRPPESITSYRLLLQLVRDYANNPNEARTNFANVVNSFDSPDVNLAVMVRNAELDPLESSILALGFMQSPRPELRGQAHELLTTSFQPMLEIISNPSKHPNLSPEALADFMRHYYSESPSFFDGQAKLLLAYAAKTRYGDNIPPVVQQMTDQVESLRQQERLVSVFQQSGPNGTSSVETCASLLRAKWGSMVSEEEVAELLRLMATSQNPADWKGDVLVKALQIQHIPNNFNWRLVIKYLDHPDFVLKDTEGLALVLEAFSAINQPPPDFSLTNLWAGRWTNYRSQLSVLKAYNSLRVDRFDVSKIGLQKKVLTQGDFVDAPTSIKALADTLESQKLNSLDTIEAILHLSSDEDLPHDVLIEGKALLERAAKLTPELLLCGAYQLPRPWSPSHENVVQSLFKSFFIGHTSYQLVFWKLWQVNKIFVAHGFISVYVADPMNIKRIWELADGFHGVQELLGVGEVNFVLDLASYAAFKGTINFEKWLKELISRHGAGVMFECLKFLKAKADEENVFTRDGSQPISARLDLSVVAAFLEVMESFENVQLEEPNMLRDVSRICVGAYPRLINYGYGKEPIILANARESPRFPRDVDEEMQETYKRLYGGDIEISDVVEYLKKLKDSDRPRDQDLFACMVHGLLDEYLCFPDYPLPALASTAVLFGSLINYGLIDGVPLKVALDLVLESIRSNSPESPMFKFGLQALMNFSERLPEWRAYCGLLSRIPTLEGTEPYRLIMEVLNSSGDRDGHGLSNGTSEGMLNGISHGVEPLQPSLPPFNSLHPDAPLNDPSFYADPEEDAQDKMLFIINNLSDQNFESKLKDLQQVLREEHFQWFADYLVQQRAKLEPNYHKLYLKILEKYGNKLLIAEVLRETYIGIAKLLNGESTINSATERGHLKNLASWLGGLTIARDKPIKHKNISFKDLLIEGYETNRLILVLPFTCKVLERCKESQVFKPPNPWLMHVMKILAELYHFAELKLQLKFEIEVLCKTLELEISDIEPATVIRERPQTAQDGIQGLADDLGELQVGETAGGFSPAAMSIALPEVSAQIIYPHAVTAFAQHPPLKPILLRAIEDAIREIIQPVVERSVTIATISTGQLIVKDFAMDGNEERMLAAAHNMVQTLAGNLALVTCKEPLRMSMNNHLRQLLAAAGVQEQAFGGDVAIAMCVNENLDLACHIVEKAAQERSLPEIDEALAQAVEARRRHREARPGQHYVDPSMSRFAFHLLPEPFRLKPGGLSPQQLGLYDQFHRFPRPTDIPMDHTRAAGSEILQDYMGMPGMPDSNNVGQPRGPGGIAPISHTPQPQPPPAVPDHKQVGDKLTKQLDSFREVAAGFGDQGLEDVLKDNQNAARMMDDILETAAHPTFLYEVTLTGAQAICNTLYTALSKRFELEAFVYLLDRLCKMSPQTAKEVINWLVAYEDDRKFNVPVTVLLIKTGLLSTPTLDAVLAKAIAARKPLSVEFLNEILRDMVLGERPLGFRTNFVNSLEEAGNWLKEDENQGAVKQLLADLENANPELDEEQDLETARNQVKYIFAEWLQLYLHVAPTEKQYFAFVYQLHKQNAINDTDSLSNFIRVCLEQSIESYEVETRRNNQLHSNNSCYIQIDAFAKLIIYLFRCQSNTETDQSMNKIGFLKSVMAIVMLYFNHQYETYSQAFPSAASLDNLASAAQFPQRIYFRFFSSLLCEYQTIARACEQWNEQVMQLFTDAFLALRPANFPYFTIGWITLISHRMYAPKVLRMGKEKGWPMYFTILDTMLTDLLYFLRELDFNIMGKHLYRGILRIFLVLIHDHTDFLTEHHFAFCDVISPYFVQLRNLVLTAIPAAFVDEVPNPFTAGLNLDRIPETRIAPTIATDYTAALRQHGLQELVEQCLSPTSPNVDVIKDIITITESLQTKDLEAGFIPITPGIRVLHALALTIGVDAISKAAARGVHIFQSNSPHTNLMMRLLLDLSPQSRYHFLNGIANNLRYANSHTQYFSALILFMFTQVQGAAVELDVRQQISRVLLERLVVQKPHPWGLIYTLLELLRNPVYNFWNLSFVKAAPEIENLFGNVIQQINEP